MTNIGKSIGAIIRDRQGRFLVQYRLRNPVGLALPAGHVDEGESPLGALKREIPEETGLKVLRAKQIFHKLIPCATLCAKGHESHEWWVYEVAAEGEPELKETDKHRFVKFMFLEEMRSYIESGEYDPNWFDHIFPALGIL